MILPKAAELKTHPTYTHPHKEQTDHLNFPGSTSTNAPALAGILITIKLREDMPDREKHNAS